MTTRVTLLYLSFVVGFCFCNADPVTFIKKCKSGDAKCTKESSQAALSEYVVGIKELDLNPLDPMTISKLDASTSGLKLIITDVSVTGLKECRIKKMSHNPETNKLAVKVLCDVNVDGHYDMSGQLLILPMQGNGPLHVKLRKFQLSADIDLEDKVGKDGKKFWNIKNWKHSYELKDKSNVVFENLFNGNEVLGRTARDLIANNGNEIIMEVGPPVIKSVASRIVSNVNKFFHKVPLEDLIDYS